MLSFSACNSSNETVLGITSETVDDVQLFEGKLERVSNFPTKHVKPRNVDVWLPENYSKDKDYAVLYMHDGQMLFDANTTWNGQEWDVDRVASQLVNNDVVKPFIIVGIWNIAEDRRSDYWPKKAYDKLSDEGVKYVAESIKKVDDEIIASNSDGYLKFITSDLKPYIDAKYSTLKDRDNTFVMGSSRGGLISMYAISEYPEVFGAAACMSTHWTGTYANENNPVPDTFLEYMDEHLPDSKTHRMYFDYGTTTLDEIYLPYQTMVNAILKKHGYTTNLRFEGAAHTENDWQERLETPLTFLLKK
ncbi:MAG: hypothetical protein BM564_04820 [Bacteroidetes bacterium MedPE-SWsnd-G2]|nr:MAG: hypothetical protein BM564_04820 [Bacteroidetes bacterium MedPE-SWsnd-G2]